MLLNCSTWSVEAESARKCSNKPETTPAVLQSLNPSSVTAVQGANRISPWVLQYEELLKPVKNLFTEVLLTEL